MQTFIMLKKIYADLRDGKIAADWLRPKLMTIIMTIMMGKSLRIGYTAWPPLFYECAFLQPKPETCLRPGSVPEFWDLLGQIFNFTPEFVEFSTFGSGKSNEKSSAFAALRDGKIDVIGPDLSYTAARLANNFSITALYLSRLIL